MVIQVPGFNKFHLRVFRRNLIDITVDTFNQTSGKQEIRRNHHTFETQLQQFLKPHPHRRIGYTGVHRIRPAKTHILIDNTGQLGRLGVGMGI